jgi:hypothetical protein
LHKYHSIRLHSKYSLVSSQINLNFVPSSCPSHSPQIPTSSNLRGRLPAALQAATAACGDCKTQDAGQEVADTPAGEQTVEDLADGRSGRDGGADETGNKRPRLFSRLLGGNGEDEWESAAKGGAGAYSAEKEGKESRTRIGDKERGV